MSGTEPEAASCLPSVASPLNAAAGPVESWDRSWPSPPESSEQTAGHGLQVGQAHPSSQKLPTAGSGGWQAWPELAASWSSLQAWTPGAWHLYSSVLPESGARVPAGKGS